MIWYNNYIESYARNRRSGGRNKEAQHGIFGKRKTV